MTRQLLADPFLEGVGAVILDEFHERNLNSDLALALLRQIRRDVRPDLMLVVMSATLDPLPVSNYLDGCPIARVDGGLHEVSVQYRPVSRPADAELVVAVIEERLSEKCDSGHLLVFLPGFGEIRRVAKRLEPAAARAGALVLPLHGSLSAVEQDRALAPERPPQDHPEHERCRDVAHDRWGDDCHRQRTGPDRPVRWCAGNRPLGNGPDQSRRG